jgi:hypothetical protein
VKETAPKRPVGRDASGLPSIGTGRAARQKIAEELREARTGEKPAKPEGTGLKVVKAEKKPKVKAKVTKADGPGFDASWNPFGQKPAPTTPPPEKKPDPVPEKPKVDFFQHVVDVNTGKKR